MSANHLRKTEYETIQAGATSRLRVILHTGRTHQIRVHFSWLGAPLVGDDLYGGVKDEILDRQALHCHSLTFIHPMTKKEITVVAPLPEDMDEWIKAHKA